MSENEKAEQIGKLAEEYSHKRGEMNHLQERLNRFQACCQTLSNQGIFQGLRADGGHILIPGQYQQVPQQQVLEGLLNHAELIRILEEKQRLAAEVQALAERLKALAPHLL